MAEPTLTLYGKMKKSRDFMLLWKHICKMLPFEKWSDEKGIHFKIKPIPALPWREILNTILVLVSVKSLCMRKLFWIYKNAFNYSYSPLKMFFHFVLWIIYCLASIFTLKWNETQKLKWVVNQYFVHATAGINIWYWVAHPKTNL